MKLLLITFIPIVIALPQLSIINCIWPCPDPLQNCVVTSSSTFCGIRDNQSWILSSQDKAPFYTGSYVSIENEPCLNVPIPPLSTNLSAIQQGQSTILWPIDSNRPQDMYLGNCGHGLYCDQRCRKKLNISSECVSSNQCRFSTCINGSCQKTNANMHRHGSYHSANLHTIQIIAAVFGLLGALLVLSILIFFCYYRRQPKKNETIETPPEVESTTIQFASDFETPAMQQSQLDESLIQHVEPPAYQP